jgi:hypothetical protein
VVARLVDEVAATEEAVRIVAIQQAGVNEGVDHGLVLRETAAIILATCRADER